MEFMGKGFHTINLWLETLENQNWEHGVTLDYLKDIATSMDARQYQATQAVEQC